MNPVLDFYLKNKQNKTKRETLFKIIQADLISLFLVVFKNFFLSIEKRKVSIFQKISLQENSVGNITSSHNDKILKYIFNRKLYEIVQ